MEMSKRDYTIYKACRDMIAEGKDLTQKGLPELPALKERTGLSDIKAKERNEIGLMVLSAMTQDSDEVDKYSPTKAAMREMENDIVDEFLEKVRRGDGEIEASEQEIKALEERSVTLLSANVHIPTNLFHPDRCTVTVESRSEYLQAREDGYKDLPEWPPEVAQQIHRANVKPVRYRYRQEE